MAKQPKKTVAEQQGKSSFLLGLAFIVIVVGFFYVAMNTNLHLTYQFPKLIPESFRVEKTGLAGTAASSTENIKYYSYENNRNPLYITTIQAVNIFVPEGKNAPPGYIKVNTAGMTLASIKNGGKPEGWVAFFDGSTSTAIKVKDINLQAPIFQQGRVVSTSTSASPTSTPSPASALAPTLASASPSATQITVDPSKLNWGSGNNVPSAQNMKIMNDLDIKYNLPSGTLGAMNGAEEDWKSDPTYKYKDRSSNGEVVIRTGPFQLSDEDIKNHGNGVDSTTFNGQAEIMARILQDYKTKNPNLMSSDPDIARDQLIYAHSSGSVPSISVIDSIRTQYISGYLDPTKDQIARRFERTDIYVANAVSGNVPYSITTNGHIYTTTATVNGQSVDIQFSAQNDEEAKKIVDQYRAAASNVQYTAPQVSASSIPTGKAETVQIGDKFVVKVGDKYVTGFYANRNDAEAQRTTIQQNLETESRINQQYEAFKTSMAAKGVTDENVIKQTFYNNVLKSDADKAVFANALGYQAPAVPVDPSIPPKLTEINKINDNVWIVNGKVFSADKFGNDPAKALLAAQQYASQQDQENIKRFAQNQGYADTGFLDSQGKPVMRKGKDYFSYENGKFNAMQNVEQQEFHKIEKIGANEVTVNYQLDKDKFVTQSVTIENKKIKITDQELKLLQQEAGKDGVPTFQKGEGNQDIITITKSEGSFQLIKTKNEADSVIQTKTIKKDSKGRITNIVDTNVLTNRVETTTFTSVLVDPTTGEIVSGSSEGVTPVEVRMPDRTIRENGFLVAHLTSKVATTEDGKPYSIISGYGYDLKTFSQYEGSFDAEGKVGEILKVDENGDAYIEKYSGDDQVVKRSLTKEEAESYGERYKKLHDEAVSLRSRQKFTEDFIRPFTQFKGLAGISSLFIDEQTLATWRETIDSMFASLYLGTEYWTSTICSSQVEIDPESIALVETPNGLITPTASVKGEKVTLANVGTGNLTFAYKVTYFVRNQRSAVARAEFKDKEIAFNVVMRPGNVPVFNKDKSVASGESEKSGRDKPVVFESKRVFSEVCIIFKTPFYTLDERLRPERREEMCDRLSEATGQATPFEDKDKGSASSGGQSGDLNSALFG